MPLTRRTPMPRGAGPTRKTPLDRGVPIARGSAPERRTQLTAAGLVRPSAARRARARAMSTQRAVVLRAMYGEDPWCRARINGVCTGLAEDGHEPLLRSRGGDPTDPNNIILVCRSCHNWAHRNPDAALAFGLMKHSWEPTA